MGSRKNTDQRSPATAGPRWKALLLLMAGVFLATSLVTFSPADWPNPHVYPHMEPMHNACGRTGAWIAFHSIRLLGVGSHILVLFLVLGAVAWLKSGQLHQKIQRMGGVIVLTGVGAASVYMLGFDHSTDLPTGYCGAAGHALGSLLEENLSTWGSFLILTYLMIAALLFTVDGFWAKLTRLSAAARTWFKVPWIALKKCARGTVSSVRWLKGVPSAAFSVAKPTISKIDQAQPSHVDSIPDASEPALKTEPRVEQAKDISKSDDIESVSKPTPKNAAIVYRHRTPPVEQNTGCYPAALDDWVLPPLSLLEEVEYGHSAQQEQQAREKAKILERALSDFRIEANVVEIDTGPVITMFELRVAPGVKVSQIVALSNDVARALKAPAVRVVAPIPGKNTVGIEVPRIDRERVRLKELMSVTGKQAQAMNLPLFLGKDASGNPLVHDLTKMPHMLIAGTTGSGKSVCINSIIMSLLMTQRPDRVKLILVDPKMVELNVFREVPHLMCPIVTDMAKAERILEWACSKMDERYALLAEAGVRSIADYNQLGEDSIRDRFRPTNEQEESQIPKHLPYIVIMIDELADLMMTSAKEVEYFLARLAQKSRAVGIHIVVATQRPEAKVVTGLIKSNLPCRCAFRVAARMDSRIVLDQNGAEVLLGQGDMLFLPPGSAQLVRAQGTFVADREVREIIADLGNKGSTDFHPELMRLPTGDTTSFTERDELFDSAVRIILETQRGSVSLLQRRLTIGYSRASRLIDQMADAGIVGQYKGSQAREVLMNMDEWEALRQQVQREQQEGYEADEEDSDTSFADEARVYSEPRT